MARQSPGGRGSDEQEDGEEGLLVGVKAPLPPPPPPPPMDSLLVFRANEPGVSARDGGWGMAGWLCCLRVGEVLGRRRAEVQLYIKECFFIVPI